MKPIKMWVVVDDLGEPEYVEYYNAVWNACIFITKKEALKMKTLQESRLDEKFKVIPVMVREVKE